LTDPPIPHRLAFDGNHDMHLAAPTRLALSSVSQLS